MVYPGHSGQRGIKVTRVSSTSEQDPPEVGVWTRAVGKVL